MKAIGRKGLSQMLFTMLSLNLVACSTTSSDWRYAPDDLAITARKVQPGEGQALLYFLNPSNVLLSGYQVYLDGQRIGKVEPESFVFGVVPKGKRVVRLVADEWGCEAGPQMYSSGSRGSRVYEWAEEFESGSTIGFAPTGPVETPKACDSAYGNWQSLKVRKLTSEDIHSRLQPLRLSAANAATWEKVAGNPWRSHPDECVSGRSTRRIGTYDQTKSRHPANYVPDGYVDALCIFEK